VSVSVRLGSVVVVVVVVVVEDAAQRDVEELGEVIAEGHDAE
jgi:hypothetical protein